MNKHDRPRILVLGGGLSDQVESAGGEFIYMGYTDKNAIEAAGHENIHGLILTGGTDVSPSLYGQAAHRKTQVPYRERDSIEMQAIEAATRRGIPILGICRGSQIINVAFGGTLHQHIPDVKGTHKWHVGHDHRIDVMKRTKLKAAMRRREPWVVSIHHQAVDRVARGFRVAARSKDGIVEAIESTQPGVWIMGVQFHPEIDTKEPTQGIFNAVVAAAAQAAGMPEPVPGEVKPKIQYHHAANTTLASKLTSPRLEAWVCFRCSIQFDDRVDHIDHMWFMHNVDLLPHLSDAEVEQVLEGGSVAEEKS